jgi:2-methylcitrate dehydratase
MSTPATVQRIGKFAYDARVSHLTPAARGVFKRNILWLVGCIGYAAQILWRV